MGPVYVLLVAAILYRTSTGSESTITVTLPAQASAQISLSSAAPSPVPSGVDPVLAVRTQRHNLLLLFQRYGENNQSLTVTGFRQLLRSLGVERLKSIATQHPSSRHHDHHHPHDHHHHHHHHPHQHHHHHTSVTAPPEHGRTTCEETRKRRHVTSPGRSASVTGTTGMAAGAQVECLNASRLLTLHGMDMHMLLGVNEFGYICPAIINQIDRKSCLAHTDEERMIESSQGIYSKKVAWIGGFIAITIISVLSLLGIILVPLMNKVFFKFLLSFLVALAVGTLSGDAFLHLLPHSHSKHYHSHGGFVNKTHTEENSEESAHLDSTWKGLTALGGLYFMFLVEHLITLIKQYKDKKTEESEKN